MPRLLLAGSLPVCICPGQLIGTDLAQHSILIQSPINLTASIPQLQVTQQASTEKPTLGAERETAPSAENRAEGQESRSHTSRRRGGNTSMGFPCSSVIQ